MAQLTTTPVLIAPLALSGLLFPVDLLPEPLQRLGQVLPLTPVVDLLRLGLTGTTAQGASVDLAASFGPAVVPLLVLAALGGRGGVGDATLVPLGAATLNRPCQTEDAVVISRWWSGRTGVERFDLSTRWPLYLLSASEPVIVLLVVARAGAGAGVGGRGPPGGGGGPHDRVRELAARGHRPPARRPPAGGAARRPGRPADGGGPGRRRRRLSGVRPRGAGRRRRFIPVGLAVAVLFCGALTVAATPLLRPRQLLGVVALPAAVVGILQATTANTDGQASWAVVYLLYVGSVVITYRLSVWLLGIVWEIDRSRDVQAQLAVAEERLRFARDLHDVLGRNLALIAVNSELAAQLVRRGQDGAVERMLQVHQTAQDSMRELREVVGGYRNADLDAELAGARSVLRSAGIGCRVIGDGADLLPRHPGRPGLGGPRGHDQRHPPQRPHHRDDRARRRARCRRWTHAVLRIENDGVRRPASGAGTRHRARRPARATGRSRRRRSPPSVPGGRFLLQARLPLTRRTRRRPGGAAAVIRILLADDEHLIRAALAALLALEDDLEVVAQAATGAEALAMARPHRPDVAVLDLQMPGLDGIAVAEALPSELPACAQHHRHQPRPARPPEAGPGRRRPRLPAQDRLGARPRRGRPHRARRRPLRRPRARRRSHQRRRQPADPPRSRRPRTRRRRRAVEEIARRASLSPGTVRNYLSSAAAKLGAANRHEAVRVARTHGWI